MSKNKLAFNAWIDGTCKQYQVTGKCAQTLAALYSTGTRGITALEMSNTWALRLAAYVHDLRKLGLDIQTLHEKHEGGWHGRYILITPIKLLDN